MSDALQFKGHFKPYIHTYQVIQHQNKGAKLNKIKIFV